MTTDDGSAERGELGRRRRLLEPLFVLRGHTTGVNAVALRMQPSGEAIIYTGFGDEQGVQWMMI